ncbi:hypothetical protein [Roseixanthobacter glucoisosaccharinicivorans]|uniref:hypothetical protein n=1 Tax=Roseixanthobacter glucoisosaccharinicivorans TaxID=3119923 RepID=UPI0037297DE7
MTRFFSTFRSVGILMAVALGAVLLFTLLGSLLIAVGLFVTALVVIGGIRYLLTGKGVVEVRTQTYRAGDFEMIDVTPPKPPRRER